MLYLPWFRNCCADECLTRADGHYELMIGTMIHTICTYFESVVYFIMIPLLNMKHELLIFCSSARRSPG